MGESTLGLKFSELKEEVADYLGYGTDSTKWGTLRTAAVEKIVQAGLRRFYWPDPDQQGNVTEWSFMKPVTTLTTVAGQEDYDLPDDYGGIIGNLTYDPQDSWRYIQIVNEGRIRAMRQTSDSVGTARPLMAAVRAKKMPKQEQTVTLTGTSGTANITLDTVDYLATFDTDLTTTAANWVTANATALATAGYTVTSALGVITVVAIEYVTDVDVSQANVSGDLAATITEVIDGTEGQRMEIMFWPTPNAIYNLAYAYNVLPDKVSTASPYPYGGAVHAQTIKCACLAEAEFSRDDVEGVRAQRFAARLQVSRNLDGKLNRTEEYGYNDDDSEVSENQQGWPRSDYAYYKNVLY